jgi:hypothetical protein
MTLQRIYISVNVTQWCRGSGVGRWANIWKIGSRNGMGNGLFSIFFILLDLFYFIKQKAECSGGFLGRTDARFRNHAEKAYLSSDRHQYITEFSELCRFSNSLRKTCWKGIVRRPILLDRRMNNRQ